MILPVVLYSCGTWSLTLREGCRLRIFENRILRRIVRPKKNENGYWRKLHNKKPDSLYGLPNIVRVIKSRRLRWARHLARMKEDRSFYQGFNKRPLGMPRHRLEDNVGMDPKEIMSMPKIGWFG